MPATNYSSDCCSNDINPDPRKLSIAPNLMVHASDGRNARFYEDLIQGRIVMINLMSISRERTYPITDNLAEASRLLGPRLGHDVFMYSLSVDPNDTPGALRAFRDRYTQSDGWTFLTAAPQVVAQIQSQLFVHGPTSPGSTTTHDHSMPHHPMNEDDPTCSLGLIRYGNDAIGVWGAAPTKSNPAWIAQRMLWITPRPASAPIAKRRGGPAPIAKQNPVSARI